MENRRRSGLRWENWCALFMALSFIAGAAQSQVSPHGKLDIQCESCHSAEGWTPLKRNLTFRHDTTAFPLSGRHVAVPCKSCHKGLKFAGSSTRCASCHTDIHRGELGVQCERCHTTQTWLVPDMPQRHAQTRFTLMGPHRTVPCEACHRNTQQNQYVNLPIQCFGCHRAQYEATTVPSHRAAGFGTDCIQCHKPTALQWPASFDHNATPFPLQGAHMTTPCLACHVGNRFRGTPMNCDACHDDAYVKTTNPNHAQSGFSKVCQTCHSSMSWQSATFDHNTFSFKLLGLHASVPCASCHTTPSYPSTPTQCVACHLAQYTAAANPVHTPSAFPQQCEICHTPAGWHPASFDHSKTNFPLTGAHATQACVGCHANGVYVGTSTACNSCHNAAFVATTSPAHVAGNFSTLCATCHTTAAWQPATFDHSKTLFPLTGAHARAGVTCAQCHVNNVYVGLSTACYSCHQAAFTSANAPPHAGFSQDCTTCHTTTAWQPATFDHSKTLFPLTGAHASASITCAQCHVNNAYAGLSTACYSCHQSNFTSANAPPHTGFSQDCTTCHTTSAWQPATFDHSKTTFPLTGAHASSSVTCAQCHVNNVYAGLSTTCSSCHQAQFTAATSPVPHLNFPMDCSKCHTTTAGWSPSTYSHSAASPRFPQDNRHLNAGCTKCHQTATDYTQYCCKNSSCHGSCAGAN